MSVLDNFETPGYSEWEAVELRLVFQQCLLLPEGDGVWLDDAEEILVVVTPAGLFAGWNNSTARLPGNPVRRLGDVEHLPPGSEPELSSTIEALRKKRLASMIQCRYCGEMFTPGWISDRCCVGCLSDEHGIIP